MKRIGSVSLLSLLVCTGCGQRSQNTSLASVDAMASRRVMVLESSVDDIYATIAQLRAGSRDSELEKMVAENSNAREYSAVNILAMDLSDSEVRELQQRGLVSAVSANKAMRKFDVHERPFSWGLDRIDQADKALDSLFGFPYQAGEGVRVYVIDTGVDPNHPEFGGRVAQGFSSVKDSNGTYDCDGHGTHVAGTVAGRQSGVAKRATVVPVRVLNCEGSGSVEGVVAGMDWVAAQKRENPGVPFVANMSLGGEDSTPVDIAAQRLWDAGVFLVVAAGNEYTDACGVSPARTPAVITVGATAPGDVKPGFSNFGPCVDIYAPGENIYSAATGTKGGVILSGTSMASPHVAGAAALILSKSPTATNAEVEETLKNRSLKGAVENLEKSAPENLLLRIEEASLRPGDTTPQPIPQTEGPTFEFAYADKISAEGYKSFYTNRAELPVGNVKVAAYFDAPKNGAISMTLSKFNDTTKKFEKIASQVRSGPDTGKIVWSGPVGLFSWEIKSSGYAGDFKIITSFQRQ